MRVLVVGAGVVGLTCAVRLCEDGHDVHVMARDLPLETVSAVAAAWWYPYLAQPQDRVATWSARTYEVLGELAGELPFVRMRRSHELFDGRPAEPWWAGAVPDLTRDDSAPQGWSGAWTFTAPVVEMRHYLPWLVERLEAAGGTLSRTALPALPAGGDVVVNASGMGNRLLASDASVHPVRGQVVRVAPCGVEDVWLAAASGSALTYVVPRSEDVVVGGTQEPDDWRADPDPQTARDILARAARIVPQIADTPVLGHRVGWRPSRPSVRLETQVRDGASPVVHCYGHGGAGVTLSWGCADEVASHVAALG
ncbi:FAD-dependent oxidoreductase [Solicola sp. PLA-1-18]|uniref:FAD-dependent oxidoreductase n=1 Tax=Solicola sp. PLA-1-18 TaxID=3380532 RepID=UPI003B804B29